MILPHGYYERSVRNDRACAPSPIEIFESTRARNDDSSFSAGKSSPEYGYMSAMSVRARLQKSIVENIVITRFEKQRHVKSSAYFANGWCEYGKTHEHSSFLLISTTETMPHYLILLFSCCSFYRFSFPFLAVSALLKRNDGCTTKYTTIELYLFRSRNVSTLCFFKSFDKRNR